MRQILFIFFMVFGLIGFGQSQYKLFLTAQVQDMTFLFKASLDKTDQIYDYEKTDTEITFKNNALKFLIIKDKTTIFFQEELIGEYKTKYWDCHTHIILEFLNTESKYFFFKLYSKDGTY